MKTNGFTLIEVLIASTLLITVVTTVFPIITLLTNEKDNLSDRRILTSKVHDELQDYLWDKEKSTPDQFTEIIRMKEVTFTFTKEKEYIKGCARWENVKKTKETICLYGISEK
ncbi:prepilin-type N-terminal cleavage/methylation domain-containing protein [Virgibacillus ainsalahensis]